MGLPARLIQNYGIPFYSVEAGTALSAVVSYLFENEISENTFIIVKHPDGTYGYIVFSQIQASDFEAPISNLTLTPVTAVLDNATRENPNIIEEEFLAEIDNVTIILEQGIVIAVLYNPSAAIQNNVFAALRAAYDTFATQLKSDDVLFSAVYPRSAAAGQRWTFFVYAHMSQEAIDVMQDVSQEAHALGDKMPAIQKTDAQRLKRGTVLTVHLESDQQAFRPIVYKQVWHGSWVRFSFDFEPEARNIGKTLTINAAILANGREIASISHCRIDITANLSSPDAAMSKRSANPYNKIFVSYSRKDKDIVEQYRLWQDVRGDDVFVDIYSIRAGENWKMSLEEAIQSADIFQLFWSEDAKQSGPVSDEWRHALAVARQRNSDGAAFIRPVYWKKPMPSPNSELEHLHFKYVPLTSLLPSTGRPDDEVFEQIKLYLQSEFTTIHETYKTLFKKLDGLEEGQTHLAVVMKGLQSGGVAQTDMREMVDALKDIIVPLKANLNQLNNDGRDALKTLDSVLETKMGLQHKFELTVPIIPLILDYKAEWNIGTDVNLSTVLASVEAKWKRLIQRFSPQDQTH